ncbi:MAG: glycosyl hydrolase family 17 protein [Candidatus Ozemobacteraceae bacterium]
MIQRKVVALLSLGVIGLAAMLFFGCSWNGGGGDVPFGPPRATGIPESGPARVSFKIILADGAGIPIHKSLIRSVLGANEPATVTFTLVILSSPAEASAPSPIPFQTLVKSVPVSNGAAEAQFSGIPARTIVGEIAISGGHLGGKTTFHGAADLQTGDNIVEVSPVGSCHRSDILARAIRILTRIPAPAGTPVDCLTARLLAVGGSAFVAPDSWSFSDLLDRFLLSLPGPQVRVQIASNGAALVLSNGNRNDRFWEGASGAPALIALRAVRILGQGAGGPFYSVWASPDSAAWAIGKGETASGTRQAHIFFPSQSLQQAVPLEDGGVLCGGRTGDGKPFVLRWNGVDNVTVDGLPTQRTGIKWTMTDFPGVGSLASGSSASSATSDLADPLEFTYLDLDRGLDFHDAVTCVLRDTKTGMECLYRIDPVSGASTGADRSNSLSVWGRSVNGTIRIDWDPLADAAGYRVWWASGTMIATSTACAARVAEPPFLLTDQASGAVLTFQVAALGTDGSETLLSLPITVKVLGVASNAAPVLSLEAETLEPRSGTLVRLTLGVSDPDGDAVRSRWSASVGTFTATSETGATWMAPDYQGNPASAVIAAEAVDERGGRATASIGLLVRPWIAGGWAWDDSAIDRISFTYGSGADFPVRGVLYKTDSHFRLTPTRDMGAWGSSFIIAPSYRKPDGSSTQFMPLTNVSCAIDGNDLIVGFSGACEGLTATGILRIFPPGENRLEASVSLEVAGDPAMGLNGGVEGSGFQVARIESMHVDDSQWDCSSAIVGGGDGGREFPIATLGTWLFPPSLGLTATRFGLRGGFSQWKPNAPTSLIELQSPLKILGYAKVTSDVNDDHVGIEACSGEVMHSYSFRIISSAEGPPAQLATVSATIESGQVKLAWTTVPGAASYNVYFATGTSITEDAAVMTVATTTVLVKRLAERWRYAFAVAAVLPTGVSAKSSPVIVRMPRRLHGICFGPFIREETPWGGISEPDLRTRINLIAPYYEWIRFYGCDDSLAKGVPIARELGLKIMVGTYLDGSASDVGQIGNLVSAANAGFVDAAVVGNELLSSGKLSIEKIQEYLASIKSQLPASVPVFLTEDIHLLTDERFRGFVGSLKQIGVNAYSFQEGKPIGDGVRFLEETLATFPTTLSDATVIVSETGWPSQGIAKSAAVPSPENALAYLKALVAFSEERARRGCAVSIFWFAAFDERWKMRDGAGNIMPDVSYEGFWGLWDENLRFKTQEIEEFFRGSEE